MGLLPTLGQQFGELYNQQITSVSGTISIIFPNNSVNASPSYGDPASYCEIRASGGNLSPVAIDSASKQAMLSNFYTSKLGAMVPTGLTARYIVTVDTNIFVAGAASDHTLRIWKSTDSGSTWTEQDGANRKSIKYQPGAAPLNGGAIVWKDFDGATIHLAYLQQEAASGAQGFVEIVTFSTTTDTWGAVITGGPTTLDYSGQQFTAGFTGFTIHRRGSDYIVHYQGTKENVGGNKDRVYRNIYTGGAWGAAAAVDGQAGLAFHFALASTVAGASSRIHVFMRKVPAGGPTVTNEMVHITFKSDNTYDAGGIQTLTGLPVGGGAFDEGQISAGINLSGEIIVPFLADGTNNQEPVKVMTATSADAPIWVTQTVYAGGTKSPSNGTARPAIGIGAIGSTPYVIWGSNEVAASEKIYQSARASGVWGTETVAFTIGHFIDALTVDHFGTALSITTAAIPEGDTGLPYTTTFTSNGSGTWALDAGAAALGAIGLSLSSAGVLSGTPTGSGSFPITVCITDADGVEVCADFTLVINPVSPYWTPGNPGGDGWHIEEDEGQDGRAACRTADGVNPMADLIASPRVTVVAGQIYYLEAFGIADPGTDGQLEIGMKFYNSAGLFMSDSFTSLGSAPTTYTRWSTTVTVPVGAVSAEFVVRVEAHLAGKWCVDNAWWTRLDTRWELSSIKHYSSDYASYR